MFSKATAKFVHQVDPDGSLIHVSRVNDSQKLATMALVVKRNRIWVWQRPKFQPTDFTLSDLLLGDNVLNPGVSEMEFLTYKGIYGDDLSGKLDAEADLVNLTLEGRGTSKLESSFGKLKKEELDVKKLLSDSHNRSVDMQHVLVQQLEKRADVLAVVKERIITTSPCSVTLTKKQQCSFQGVLGLLGLLGSSVKVCVKDLNNMEMNSDISLEIPSGTVIAYSILELEIKKDGHYDICLGPSSIGGFEEDSASGDDSYTTVDGKFNGRTLQEETLWDVLQNASDELELSPLAELSQSSRSYLMNKLQEMLMERPALSYLQSLLEKLCMDEAVDTTFSEELPDIFRNVVVDYPDLSCPSKKSKKNVPANLNAVFLLVSALEELPDETLILLSATTPDFLKALDELMRSLKVNSEQFKVDFLPERLQDNKTFQQTKQLFRSISVTLKRESEQLWMETGNDAGVLPVVFMLSIRGLALLCTGL